MEGLAADAGRAASSASTRPSTCCATTDFASTSSRSSADGNLSLDHDPKTAWALAHPEHFPLEVMRAPRELLVRVPGIGPLAARRLVAARRQRDAAVRGATCAASGVDVARAGWFLTLRGRRLATAPPPSSSGSSRTART